MRFHESLQNNETIRQENVKMFLSKMCKTMPRKCVKLRVWQYRLNQVPGRGACPRTPLELVLRHNLAVPLYNCRRQPWAGWRRPQGFRYLSQRVFIRSFTNIVNMLVGIIPRPISITSQIPPGTPELWPLNCPNLSKIRVSAL